MTKDDLIKLVNYRTLTYAAPTPVLRSSVFCDKRKQMIILLGETNGY